MSLSVATLRPSMELDCIFDTLHRVLTVNGDFRRTRHELSLNKLDKIEGRIASLTVAVKSLRNAFAPVHKLPIETLAHIFSVLVEPPSKFSFIPDVDSMTDPYAWIRVTHVCRHWRAVALSFPSLWTTVDGSHPHAALACLTRSVQAPLHVYLHDKIQRTRIRATLEDDGLVQLLAPHSARFVELQLEPKFRYRSTLLEEFCFPAPQLRALSLGPNLADADQSVLPTLFAGETPRLERLALCGFTSWPGNTFVDLTHLCLYGQVQKARPPMHDFVAMLAACPRLEELIVCGAGPDAEDATPRLVALPALRRLSLGFWFSAEVVACFLSHLAIPEDAEMQLWSDDLVRRDQPIAALFPEDTTHLRPLQVLGAVSLVKDDIQWRQLLSVHKGRLVVHGSFESGASLPSLFGALNLQQVTKLTISGVWEPQPTREQWRGIFDSLLHLTELAIKSCASREMLKALCLDANPARVLPPCPKLATLSVTNGKQISMIYLFLLAKERAYLGRPLEDIMVLQQQHISAPSWQQLEDVMSDIQPYLTSSTRCVKIGFEEEPSPCCEAYDWSIGKMKGRPHRRT